MDFSEDYYYRFSGIERLYGSSNLKKIHCGRALVIGLGGVGSWCAEALARSGLGSIHLMDFDDICLSNTNRQLHAHQDSVGKMKTSEMASRLKSINPEIELKIFDESYGEEINPRLFTEDYDVVVDAIDDANAKFQLILACRERAIPLVISGAAGGRLDPSQIQWADLSRSREDKMLSLLRKRLRQKADFPRKGSMHLDCVFSIEKPRYLDERGEPSLEKPGSFRKPLDCSTGFGTATQVTGSFGFQLSYLALRHVINKKSADS